MPNLPKATASSDRSPKFSVVIPAYNASPFLADCLNSVLAQTDPDFEMIVVNDGSTDNTAEIAAWFAQRDRRIVLINRVNGGLAAARNNGIAAAKGELVAFLDADDRWCPKKLAAHRQAMDSDPNASVSYDWAAFIDVKGDRTGLHMSQSRIHLTHEVLLLKNYLGNGSTAVVRRYVLEQAKGFNSSLRRMVDQELWVRLTFYGHRFHLIPRTLTEYRTHPDSFTADTGRMLQGLETFLQQVAVYAPNSVRRLKPLAIAFTHRWMARAAFVAGNYALAKQHAQKSLQASPAVLWRDPRAPITFVAIAIQSITPKPIFNQFLQLGHHLTSRWFQVRSSRQAKV
ncbi:MAG: glycosyltransferase family 2 protein [Leptolyngbyaceae cyanobacterium SM1_4_3]|nr:glycosyltransferase family 2 protein [Leptolyngbyaceae cyanobacterium SM1_4_3]NJN89998.1 glycosyltransferase family 2 protein [Leptolyngbyaceae cyanobacterium SL_5_14]